MGTDIGICGWNEEREQQIAFLDRVMDIRYDREKQLYGAVLGVSWDTLRTVSQRLYTERHPEYVELPDSIKGWFKGARWYNLTIMVDEVDLELSIKEEVISPLRLVRYRNMCERLIKIVPEDERIQKQLELFTFLVDHNLMLYPC